MLGLSRKTFGPEVIDARKTRQLGRVRGHEYIAVKGEEYRLDSTRYGSSGEAPQSADVVVSIPVEARDGEQALVVGGVYRAAYRVSPGTYAAELEKAQRPRRADHPRPVDALAGLHLLAARPDRMVPVGGHAFAPFSVADKAPGGYVRGRGPIRGAPAILEAVRATGADLELRGDRLDPVAPGGRLPARVAEVIRAAEPLLLPYKLTGKEPACEYRHGKDTPPPAWTVTAGGVLACEAHATGELER